MSLTREIERLRGEVIGGDMFGIMGRSILGTPIQANRNTDTKDMLIASALKAITGGLLTGFGQARGTSKSQGLINEALQLDRALTQGKMSPDDILDTDYSPEASGLVGAILGQHQDREAQTNLLVKKLTDAKDLATFKDELTGDRQLALLKEKAKLGGFKPKVIVEGNKPEDLASFMTKKALEKLSSEARKIKTQEDSLLTTMRKFHELRAKFPHEDLSKPSGWGNSLTRQWDAYFGDKDANAIAQNIQGALNDLVEINAGTQTEGDIWRRVKQLKGVSAIESLDIIAREFKGWEQDIMNSRRGRHDFMRALMDGNADPAIVASTLSGYSPAKEKRAKISKLKASLQQDLSPEVRQEVEAALKDLGEL